MKLGASEEITSPINYTMEPGLLAAYELLGDVLLDGARPPYCEALKKIIRVAQASEHSGFPISALPLLVCEAVGADAQEAVPVTAAWRALHIAAKLLDDVEDDYAAPGGNTLPSFDHRIRIAQSINLATSFIVASSLLVQKLRAPSSHAVQRDINRTVLRMMGGQHADLEIGGQLTLEEYMQIMEDKTGAFFALATRMGALCGSADSKLVSGLEQFGHCVGMMIQILDDWSDWYKPEGQSDLSRGKVTLPLHYAFTVASADDQQLLGRLAADAPFDPQAELRLQELLKSIGVNQFMVTELEFYRRQAEYRLQECQLHSCSVDRLRNWLQGLLAVRH